MIATESVTCIIATERSSNVTVAEGTTDIIAKGPQILDIATGVGLCIIVIESVSCIVSTETATCRIDYRNFHMQKWCQPEILLVIIKKLSEWVSTKFQAK